MVALVDQALALNPSFARGWTISDITGTAVLEFGPAETSSPVGAMSARRRPRLLRPVSPQLIPLSKNPEPSQSPGGTAARLITRTRLSPSPTSPIRPAVPRFSPGKSLSGKERGGPKRRKSAVRGRDTHY
jgi:hypothetical protein